MKHKLTIEVTESAPGEDAAYLHIEGDHHVIARAIYGLAQNNNDMLEMLMEVLLNGLTGSRLNLKEYIDFNKN